MLVCNRRHPCALSIFHVREREINVDIYGCVLRPAQQVGIGSGRRTVWEKETRDRIKVLKMGLGDSRLLGSRALFLGATSLLFSLGKQKVSVVLRWSQPPVFPVTSPILFSTLNYLCYILVQGLSLVGGHRPAYALGKHLSVCTSSVLNFHGSSVPRSTLYFSLA